MEPAFIITFGFLLAIIVFLISRNKQKRPVSKNIKFQYRIRASWIFSRKLFLGKEKKKALQLIVDYVEGNLGINELKLLIQTDDHLKKILKKPFDFSWESYERYHFNIYDYLVAEHPFMRNWDTVKTRYDLYMQLTRFLDWFRIPYDMSYTKYKDDDSFIWAIQPSWMITGDDLELFDKILEEVPKDLSKTKQIEWGEARIKELFRYDETYPCWIQDPEWPIVNGKPLVFSHQKDLGEDDARTYFYFYDPDTKEETVVMQLD